MTGGRRDLFDTQSAVAFTDVTPKQLRYWVETGIVKPAAIEGEGHGRRYFFDFLNLVSIRTVVALRQKALPLQRIRKAIAILEKDFKIEQALTKLNLFTDGQTVFILGEGPDVVYDVLRRGQAVFAIAIDEIVGDLSKRLNVTFEEIRKQWNEQANRRSAANQ